jgi:diketogulonate reductase-like aldo/keto reductase
MEQVVEDAIDAGYRHIDTALFYENEKEAGAAIKTKLQKESSKGKTYLPRQRED